MKTILKLECPYCGAPLEYEEGREQMFCQYCGKKILLVDENTYNINQTIRHIDEAEIKKAEVQQSVELKRIEFAEKKRQAKERVRKSKVFFSLLLGAIGILMLTIGYMKGKASGDSDSGHYMVSLIGYFPLMGALYVWLLPSSDDNDDDYDFGTIRIPQSISDYENKTFEAIKAQLSGAGFTNIKCVSLHDLTFGLLTKPGTVESIIINGQPISSYKKKYLPDAPIIISYHSK